MTTTRIDLFTVLHKGLRRSMYETGSILEQANFANPGEKNLALASLTRTLDFFEEHLRLEGANVAPLLKESSSKLLGELKGQHDEHEDATKRMRDLKQELSKSGGDSALALGLQLCKSYNEMVADQSIHMNREERMANPALWSAHQDELLATVRDKVQAAHEPERLNAWLELLLQGANEQETIELLCNTKQTASPEAFEKACLFAKKLRGNRWEPIAQALED